ncbi:hypothetical protein P5673_018652 [Acropora cervicornis]|uniref:Uncharacterized protein n=1 Tax=Acropora cervicornis TaxID=6130 RepID=A0AAD9QD49_ACRCE|nr:hypothetical protein P5673_018652 [Acropora cervicornis]
MSHNALTYLPRLIDKPSIKLADTCSLRSQKTYQYCTSLRSHMRLLYWQIFNHPPFSLLLAVNRAVLFFPVKMSAEGESPSPTHADVLNDVPGMVCKVDMATYKHILNSLNYGPDGRPYSQESDLERRRSNSKRARENSPSDDDLTLHAQNDLNDDEDLKLLTEHSSTIGQARETPAPEDDDTTGDKILQQLEVIGTKPWGKKLYTENFSQKKQMA